MNINGTNGVNSAGVSDQSGVSTKVATHGQTTQEKSKDIIAPQESSTGSASHVVSISKKGQAALASDLGSTLHAQGATVASSSSAVGGAGKSKTSSGQNLERLQKKLKVLKQQQKELVNDKSEQGQDKLKAIRLQVAQLTVQIADLTKVTSPQTPKA